MRAALSAMTMLALVSACAADDGLPPSADTAALAAPYPTLVPFDDLTVPATDPQPADPEAAARIAALAARASALAPEVLTDAERAALVRK